MRQIPSRPPRDRRYGWFRLYNGFSAHPKWRVISGKLRVPLHQVVAVAVAILEVANKSRPRGSISEFSVLECGAALDIPADNVANIYAALEDFGWIDQEYVSTWDERQPDKEDPTGKERQRRLRAKRRLQREAALATGIAPVNEPKPAFEPTPFTERGPSTTPAALRMRKYRDQRRRLGLLACFKPSLYRDALIARDMEQCIYCLGVNRLQIDHILPIFQGGTDDLDNMGFACKLCNVRKGARTPEGAEMPIVVESAYHAYQRYKASPACAEGVLRVRQVVRAARQGEPEENQSLNCVTAEKRDATPRLDRDSGKKGDVTPLRAGDRVTYDRVEEMRRQGTLRLGPVIAAQRGNR